MSQPAIMFCYCLVHAECFIGSGTDRLRVAVLLVKSTTHPAVAPFCCFLSSHEVLHSIIIYMTIRSIIVTTA